MYVNGNTFPKGGDQPLSTAGRVSLLAHIIVVSVQEVTLIAI